MTTSKIALLFPGQGTQYIGMNTKIYNISPVAASVFQEAFRILRPNVTVMGFLESNQVQAFQRTEYVQPTVFVTNHALYSALIEMLPNLKYHATAGHSLGEYNALIASEAISYESSLRLVQIRAQLSGEVQSHGLVALKSRDKDLTAKLEKLEKLGIKIALVNSPREVVVSPYRDITMEDVQRIYEKDVRVLPLGVNVPFHTDEMQGVAFSFKEELTKARLKFNPAKIPVVANSTADYIRAPEAIIDELYSQLFNPVLWTQSIRRMIDDGVDVFIVVGADRKEVIKRLVNETNPNVEVLVVKDGASLEEVVARLGK